MSIDNSYLLQQYENGKFGYYLIDGNDQYSYGDGFLQRYESKVICMQEIDEDRDEFISKNNIIIKKNSGGIIL